MNRGRSNRRYILPEDASCFASGKWGRRRVRTSECWATIRAEDTYTAVAASKLPAGASGTRAKVTWTIGARHLMGECELVPNPIWRAGRLFLICPRCAHRCTRLYLPLESSWLACRQCWGLTYDSRAISNYKDSLWGRGAFARMFRTTHRDWAFLTTHERREARRQSSRERIATRWPRP